MSEPNSPELAKVLSNIDRVCGATPDIDDAEEWIYLEPKVHPDQAFFKYLQQNWSTIVPAASRNNFALIYCRFEPDSGVWLHYLSTALLRSNYWTGCHDIHDWATS